MAELAPSDGADEYRLGFAGDTFNTAWYLRRLRPDLSVSFLSAVGSDDISGRMLDFMDRSGIGTEHVARHAGRSVGLYMISLKDGERSFAYWRDTSAARLLADDETRLRQAIDTADLIYFSGITLAILSEAARMRLLGVLDAARAKGRTVAFDPNLRPHLWSDDGTMRATVMRAAVVSDIVLPSHEDEAAHFGDADPQATAARYAAFGTGTVVVKNGGGAVHYLNGEGRGTVAIEPACDVVDTTAAGDSFNAGFLATIDTPSSPEARIRAAADVARQVIGGRGALVPLATPAVFGRTG